ncbi:MAG TPA: sugar phosphate nucleotidyltransferase [Gemmatimonadales bacterium]|jgi:glucose-1-phosphate thymidylyltransferase
MSHAPVAVILAAGLGSRMRDASAPATLTDAQRAVATLGIKGMIPDGRGRPFLDHVLSALADGGVREACLVVGPEAGAIKDHFQQAGARRVRVSFAVQPTPTGTADAVLAAAPWAAGRDFLVLNADNLYPSQAIGALVELGRPGLVAFDSEVLVRQGNIPADRMASYAILGLRDDDTLMAIIEKPSARDIEQMASHWISMNLWRFDTTILDACRDVVPSPRGERELPLAVALAVARGARLDVVRMAAGVLDLSHRGDIADVARRLADREIAP